MKSLAEKVWSKVDRRSDDECWPWLGAKGKHGHGHLLRGGRGSKFVTAHRAVYELTFGEVPEGREVCHSCDNRACCNLRHLWLGTHHDNMMDMAKKQRSPRRKLVAEEVREVRSLFASGAFTFTDLGVRFDISRVQVKNIVTGKQWRWM